MSVAAADAVLYIDDENYLEMPLRMYSQTSASPQVPRITSAINETNLDGTHHYTFPINHGFTKRRTDTNLNYRVVGNYNPVDNNLYAPLPRTIISTGSAYLGENFWWSAKANTHKAAYMAVRENTTNRIYQIDTAGNRTSLTLPAALSGASIAITGMTAHKTYLYVSLMSTSTWVNNQRYNLVTGTWQDIAGTIYKYATLRNRLYGVQISGEVWSVTNEEAAGAATYATITKAGPWNSTLDSVLDVCTFNGAIWITKESGLYRFDGVDAVRVIDQRLDYMTEYNGALYFMSSGWLCRFTGSLFEKLQYFGLAEYVLDLQAHANNLYILSRPNTSTLKFGGSTADGAIDNRIFEFDGVNFRVAYEEDSYNFGMRLCSVGDYLLLGEASNFTFPSTISGFNFNNRYKARVTEQPYPYIITADFDGDLPNINKIMRRIEVDVANMGASDTITVKYQIYRDNAWSSEYTESDLTATSDNYIEFPTNQSSEYNVFRLIRLRVTLNLANGSLASLSGVTIHYTVQPPHRYKFSLTTPVTNNLIKKHDGSDYSVMVAGDSFSPTPMTTQALLDKLLNSTTNKAFFLSPQTAKLQSAWAYTAGSSSLVIDGYLSFGGSDTPKPHPLIAVKNSLGYWNIFRVKTIAATAAATTITTMASNEFTIASAACDAGAEVRLCYMVNDFSIVNQSFIFDDNNAPLDTDGVTLLERDLTLHFSEI